MRFKPTVCNLPLFLRIHALHSRRVNTGVPRPPVDPQAAFLSPQYLIPFLVLALETSWNPFTQTRPCFTTSINGRTFTIQQVIPSQTVTLCGGQSSRLDVWPSEFPRSCDLLNIILEPWNIQTSVNSLRLSIKQCNDSLTAHRFSLSVPLRSQIPSTPFQLRSSKLRRLVSYR